MTRVLAMLAILGLIVGSFVAPTQAKTVDATNMTMNAAMPGDMPCCHDKRALDCAKGCPLAIMCFAVSLPAGAVSSLAASRIVIFESTLPLDDAVMNGVSESPPKRPPRT
jgi:hypothetical protein